MRPYKLAVAITLTHQCDCLALNLMHRYDRITIVRFHSTGVMRTKSKNQINFSYCISSIVRALRSHHTHTQTRTGIDGHRTQEFDFQVYALYGRCSGIVVDFCMKLLILFIECLFGQQANDECLPAMRVRGRRTKT